MDRWIDKQTNGSIQTLNKDTNKPTNENIDCNSRNKQTNRQMKPYTRQTNR